MTVLDLCSIDEVYLEQSQYMKESGKLELLVCIGYQTVSLSSSSVLYATAC